MKKQGVYLDIAKKLVELRKSRNLSQDEIATQLGMAQSTYAGYEAASRKIPMDLLVRLADYFQVSTDFLLGKAANERVIRSDNLFGKRAQAARLDLGLSHEELAEKLRSATFEPVRMTEKELNEVERGLHTLSMPERRVESLARALEVSADYLMGDSNEKGEAPPSRETFGGKLKRLRQATRRTKYDVAHAIGATVLDVDFWERDATEMDADVLRRFCELHGVHPSVLVRTLRKRARPGVVEEQSQMLDEKANEVLLSIEQLFLMLNANGQAKLLEYAQDIADSAKYCRIDND